MKYPNAVVMQFAKAPEQGKVKTRLHSCLGEYQSTQLHKALLEHTFRQLNESPLCHYELWSNDINNEYIQYIRDKTLCKLFNQKGSTLGDKMAAALDHALERFDYAVLVGSDCPAVSLAYIEQAIAKLKSGADVVLGPAMDGGYVLVGASKSCQQIFEGVAWGTDQVLSQTRRLLKGSGIHWAELQTLQDIDVEEDLPALKEYPELSVWASA